MRLELAAGRLREKEELNSEIEELKRKLGVEVETRKSRKRGSDEVENQVGEDSEGRGGDDNKNGKKII